MEEKSLRSNTLKGWCKKVGGDPYDKKNGRHGGYFGCDINGSKLEVNRRKGRKNNVMLKERGRGAPRLGLATNSALVCDEQDGFEQCWVETPKATLFPTEDGWDDSPPKANRMGEEKKVWEVR